MTIVIPAAPAPPPRKYGIDFTKPVLYGFAVILCVLILLPLSWLFLYSLTDAKGALTLANFYRLFTESSFYDPLVTTFIIATSSAVICCAVAAPMGWLVARTDLPFSGVIRALVTASFVTPPFLGAIAWEVLAAPPGGPPAPEPADGRRSGRSGCWSARSRHWPRRRRPHTPPAPPAG